MMKQHNRFKKGELPQDPGQVLVLLNRLYDRAMEAQQPCVLEKDILEIVGEPVEIKTRNYLNKVWVLDRTWGGQHVVTKDDDGLKADCLCGWWCKTKARLQTERAIDKHFRQVVKG